MARFYFNLEEAGRTTMDREGTELADSDAAQAHAVVIAREIMRNDDYRVLTCRLCVQDSDRNPCFDLLFATVAERLDMLPWHTRDAIQKHAGSIAGLHGDIRNLQTSLQQLRATLARSEGRLRLAALNGTRLES